MAAAEDLRLRLPAAMPPDAMLAAAAQTAYEAGIHYVLPGRSPPYRAVTGWAAALDRALFCLDRLAPLDKARLVSALVATIGRDGVMTANESELLRAICASLHCPLPPLILSHVKSPV
jgi:phosphoribosylformimino-5-aminoimidazole carboxamide ribonucleotide (ProFAR) isomerase